MKNITLTFTHAEVQLILKALARLPFGEVYGLIEKIVRGEQAQADHDMNLGKPLAADLLARSLSARSKKTATKKATKKSLTKKAAAKKK